MTWDVGQKIRIVACLMLLLAGCHSLTPQERVLSRPHYGGIAPSWPAESIKITASDRSLDSPPVLKARSEQLGPTPILFQTGKVRARVVVGEDGSVRNVEVFESSARSCIASALPELKRCSFFPAKKGGIAVESVVECTVLLYYIDE